MKKSKLALCIICFVLVTLTLFNGSASIHVVGYNGVSDANVQRLETRLESVKKEISDLEDKRKATKNQKNAALEDKMYLDEQIKLKQDEIEITQALVKSLTVSIAEKDAEIKKKEEAYAKKLASFKERLRINREEGSSSYLSILLGAKGLSDFFNRADRIESMIEYDNNMMKSIAQDKAELELEREELRMALDQQREHEINLKTAEEDLAKKAEQAAGYINQLLEDESEYTAQLAEKEKERDKLDKELDEYVKELQKQNTKYVGGTYMWPVPTNYTYVSSECEWRISPISGRSEFHNGMDIPVAFGSDIYAANAGTVKISTWHNSYGYYVMIDHGGGNATLYAHNSKLLVSVGDVVEKGQVIAKAGSTGDSTGNHCHFSIYENGAIINPRKYFPK